MLKEEEVDELFQQAEATEGYQLTVDLAAQTVTRPDGKQYGFEVDAFRKHCLLNGLDDIGLTLQDAEASRPSKFATSRASLGCSARSSSLYDKQGGSVSSCGKILAMAPRLPAPFGNAKAEAGAERKPGGLSPSVRPASM